METLLEQILESPRLGLYSQRIQETLEAERLKRHDFYAMINEDSNAEFINGEIVYHSPIRHAHSEASDRLFLLLSAYVDLKDLGEVRHERVMISLTRNDYEPDICFFVKSKSRLFEARQLHFPAPDLVVEVLSESTEKNDRGVKFEDYAAHGVAEYWIIDPEAQIIEQYVLRGEQFELLLKVNSGRLKSTVIPDFEIPVRAVFDKGENLAALKAIVSSGP